MRSGHEAIPSQRQMDRKTTALGWNLTTMRPTDLLAVIVLAAIGLWFGNAAHGFVRGLFAPKYQGVVLHAQTDWAPLTAPMTKADCEQWKIRAALSAASDGIVTFYDCMKVGDSKP